jgi:hypothetical protein
MKYEDLTISTSGQTVFTLSFTPQNPTNTFLVLRGQVRKYGASDDFTISGTTLTWNDPGGLTLIAGEDFRIWYDVNLQSGVIASIVTNDSSVSGATVKDALETLDGQSGVTTVFGRSGAVTAQLNDYEASEVNNDSGVTGATVKDALDNLDGAIPTTFSHIDYPDSSGNYGNRRIRAIGATGSYRLNFHVPKHYTGTLSVKLIGYPVSGAGGAAKDIDLSGDYTVASAQSYQQYTFSDTTSTYNTGTDDLRWEGDISSLFTNLAAGSEGGIFVDHKGIGGTINYIGIEVTST